MSRASSITGASVESLSTLGYAAEQSGVDFESLQGGIIKMDRALSALASGGKKGDVFKKIGLSLGDLKDLSPDRQFELIATKLKAISNPAEKAAMTMEIFGKSGAELLPLLNRGGAGIEALSAHAKALGLVMSTADAEAGAEFGHILTDLWDVMRMGAFQIGSSLAPVLRVLVMNLTGGIQAVTKFVAAHKGIILGVAAGAAALIAGGAALIVFGTALTAIATVAGAVVAGVTLIGAALGIILSPIGLVVAGILAAAYALVHFSNIGTQIKAYLGPIFSGLAADTTEAFGGILDAIKSGDWSTAAKILWTYIQLEFEKGKAAVLEKWIGLKSSLITTWYDTVAALQTGVSYVYEVFLAGFTGMRALVETFLNWFTNAWKSAVNFTADLIQNLFMTTAKGQLKEALDDIDAKQASGKLKQPEADKARAAAQATFGAGTDVTGNRSRDAARAADYAATRKNIEAEYSADIARISRDGNARRVGIDLERAAQVKRIAAELAAAKAAGTPEATKRIAELTAQLKGLTTKASSGGPAASPFKTPDFNSADIAGALAGAMKATASGTFSAQAAQGMYGNDGIERQIADNTRESNEHLRKLVEKMDKMKAFNPSFS